MEKIDIHLQVNGIGHDVSVFPGEVLLDVLRDRLNYTGTKEGCDGTGECGACTVLLDGKAVYSCLILAVNAAGKEITTIEHLAQGTALHPLQQAFLETGAVQCGFCTPGMILTAKALLDQKPNPDEKDIRDALSGVLCRCTGYQKIIQAVQRASRKLRDGV